jgi:hypothetical protein
MSLVYNISYCSMKDISVLECKKSVGSHVRISCMKREKNNGSRIETNSGQKSVVRG